MSNFFSKLEKIKIKAEEVKDKLNFVKKSQHTTIQSENENCSKKPSPAKFFQSGSDYSINSFDDSPIGTRLYRPGSARLNPFKQDF